VLFPLKKKYKTKRSTAHAHKPSDRVTRTPLKTGGELRCSGKVNSTCSTNGILRDHLVTNPVIIREWEEHREVLTTSGTNPWSFVSQISITVNHPFGIFKLFLNIAKMQIALFHVCLEGMRYQNQYNAKSIIQI
jgi:hypothetical protein